MPRQEQASKPVRRSYRLRVRFRNKGPPAVRFLQTPGGLFLMERVP
jgi:hypothetical protein